MTGTGTGSVDDEDPFEFHITNQDAYQYELVNDLDIKELLAELNDTGLTIEAIMREMDNETWTGRIKCVGHCKRKNQPFYSQTNGGNIRKLIVRQHITRCHRPEGYQPPSPKITKEADYDYELVNDPRINELLDGYKAIGYTIDGIQKQMKDGNSTGLIKCVGRCKTYNRAFVNGSAVKHVNTISTFYVKRHITSCHKPDEYVGKTLPGTKRSITGEPVLVLEKAEVKLENSDFQGSEDSNEKVDSELQVHVMNQSKASEESTSNRFAPQEELKIERSAQSWIVGASGSATTNAEYELVTDPKIEELLIELKENGLTIDAILREIEDETWTGWIKCVGHCKADNKPFKARHSGELIRHNLVRKHIMTKHMPEGYQPPSPKADYDYELVNDPYINEMLDGYKESGYTIEDIQKQMEDGIWTGLIKCVGLCKQNNKPIIALKKDNSLVKRIRKCYVKQHIESCHKPELTNYHYELVKGPEVEEMLDGYVETGHTIEAIMKEMFDGTWTGRIKCVGLCKSTVKTFPAYHRDGKARGIRKDRVARHIKNYHLPDGYRPLSRRSSPEVSNVYVYELLQTGKGYENQGAARCI